MFIIGIAGGSGSGKTTFTQKLQSLVDTPITTIHMDSYYLPTLPPNISTEHGGLNFDHPHAFDWPLLKEHLTAIKSGNDIDSPVYDFSTSSRTNKVEKLKHTDVILLEGIFSLFDPEIRNQLNIKIFLQVEADIRFTRRLHRDVNERGRSLDSIIEQYYQTVRPMYKKFLEPQLPHADFIVGEETSIAANILAAKIKEVIHEQKY